ncbi:Ankyrin-1 [Araneus ventricosus]|uniref:Ankyrin-1 n=1 Tax=Araneus ventricosus TaxID=182803 RepID=A0A4Y2KE35_ARAVE|nr:Ankyrin-1 [Araneus ventricosus]
MFSLARNARQTANIAGYRKDYNLLSLTAKSRECVVSEFNDLDEVSAKILYIDILKAVKGVISDDKIDSLMNLSLVLKEVSKTKSDECLTNCQHTEGIGHFNLVSLACKNKAIKVLEFLFSEESQTLYNMSMKLTGVCEKELLSITDEFCHNAFYYAIRSNMTDLMKILIDKWTSHYFDEELDDLLSHSYKELKLRNVSLTMEMQLLVQSKILDLRFFHESTGGNSGTGNSWEEIKNRIELVVRCAQSIRTDYWDRDPDEKLIFIAEFIAKNIHVLKYLLKSTYDRLPWEEIEFCLTIFIKCCKNSSEPNLVYNSVLNKKQLLSHLLNFSAALDSQHHNFENSNVMRLAKSVKLPRDSVIDNIIKENSKFRKLYDDYEKIRDFCSLEIIESYADLIEYSDTTEERRHLLVLRVLQVMGEHMKNTLDSPKLTSKTANALLSSLSFNTRNIITKLRDALSHEESLYIRSEIERKVHLFKNIPRDILKIKVEITNMLSMMRIDSVKNLMTKVRSCDTFEGIKELYGPFYSTVDLHAKEIEKEFVNTSIKGDFERLEELISLLDKILNDKTISEKSLFDQIHYLIQRQKDRSENLVQTNLYSTAFHHNIYISTQMYSSDILYVIRDMVDIFSETITSESSLKPLRKFEHIELLLHELLCRVISRSVSSGNSEVYRIIFSIVDFMHFEKRSVKWIEEFRDIMKQNKILINHILPENLLTSKLSVLKESLREFDLKDGGSSVDFSSFVSNPELRAVLEILVLDISCLLERYFSRNPFFLDSDFPFLIGKNLRNHLAHGNALINICLEDSCAQLLENVKKFLTQMSNDGKKIDKVIKCDCAKLERSIDYSLEIIGTQGKLFTALEKGNLKEIEKCVNEGADVYGKDCNSSTCLHFAGRAPDIAAVKWALAKGLDVSSKDNVGQSVLHTAAKFNRTEVIRYLVERKRTALDTCDVNGKTPLHVAVENGSNDVVEYVSKLEINTTVKDKNGSTPLHSAIYRHNIDAAKMLLEKEANVDENKSYCNLTALHIATLSESLSLVGLLIAKKANVNSKSDLGETPLHIASSLGNFEIAESLVLKNADVNARNEAGVTPLHYAVCRDKKRIVEFLLKHKADVNVSDDEQFSPLMTAAIKGNTSISELLVRKGALVNSKDNFGFTPLHFAAARGHCEIVDLLLNHKAIIDCRNGKKQTALHLSAIVGHKEVVELLLKEGASINASESTKSTPLHLAVRGGHRDIVDLLIDEGADIDCKDESGSTALHHAALNANRDIVGSLLKKGADIRAGDANKITPLYLLISKGLSDLLTSEDKNCNYSDANGFTLLHFAALFGDQILVAYCIKNGSDINAPSKSGLTALHLAAQCHHPETVSFLLNNGADIEAKNEKGSTPLFLAVKSECKDTVKMLVSHKMYDMKSRSNDKIKALLYSICLGKSDVVNILLENYKFHIDNDVKLQLLDHAVRSNQKHVVATLLDRGFEINGGSELLFTAVINKQYEMVEFLLSKGANPMLSDKDNLTPFQSAASLGDVEMLEVLLSQKTGIRIESEVTVSAAEIAIYKNRLDVIKYLLQMKVINADARGKSGYTLLHTSAFYGSLDITRCLVVEGADINAKDEKERKPIHIAAEKGFKELVEFYLNCKDLGKETSPLLLLAASNRKAKMSELLRKRNSDATRNDWSAVNSKHLALLEGQKDVLCVSLNYGAYYKEFPSALLQVTKVKDVAPLLIKVSEFFTAVRKNMASEVETFLKEQNSSEYCLVNSKCVSKGNPSQVEFYLNCNDLGKESGLLLIAAASYGKANVCDLLLKRNYKVNACHVNEAIIIKSALVKDHKEVLLVLLHYGAYYNAHPLPQIDNGAASLLTTVKKLFTAAQNNAPSEVETLLKEESNPKYCLANARCVRKETVLHYASWNGYNEIVDILLKYNANSNPRTNTGNTPLHYAAKYSHFSIVKALLSNGAIYNELSQTGKAPLDYATDREMQDFFLFLNTIFTKVQDNDLSVLEDLRGKDEGVMRAVIRAKNEEGNTLLEVAHICNFPGIDELQMLFETDINNDLMLAETFLNEERFTEAFSTYEKVLKKRFEIFGPDSHPVLDIKFKQAVLYEIQQKFDKALDFFQEVHRIRKNSLGGNHKKTLSSEIRIGFVILKQGKRQEALNIFKVIDARQKETFQLGDLNVLYNKLGISTALYEMNRFVEALNFIIEVEESFSQKKDKLWSALTYFKDTKAKIFRMQGKYSEALELFKDVYESRKRALTPHHSETLNVLSSIANVLFLQKKDDESLGVYRKVLDIQRSHLPEDHIDILQSEFFIGDVLLSQQMLVTALKIFSSLERRIAAFGQECALMKEIKDRIETLKDTFSRIGFHRVFERIKNHSRQTEKNPFEVAVQVLESIGEKAIVQSENPITN